MHRNYKAFTLIELIIVIAIVSLVAAAVFVSVDPEKRLGKAKDSQRLQALNAIAKSFNLYTADYASIPTDFDIASIKKGDKIVLCSVSQQLTCDGQSHDCLVIDDVNFLGKYLPNLPVDPDKNDTTDTGYYITRDADRNISFGACQSYDQGASLKISSNTRIDPYIGIFRSVGPNNTTTLASGSANAMTISGNDLNLTSSLPDNIGVGDVIQYDSDDNASIDSLAFIQARYSDIHYSVVDVDGDIPTPTDSADTDWDIFRAYSSIYDAERGVENVGIDDALENFDTWTNGKDLVSSDQQWNIALYADDADCCGVDVNGWTTDSEHYIRLFTPYLLSEVGTSQRHDGVWDDNKYNISYPTPGYYSMILTIVDSYVEIDGLQIYIGGTQGYNWGVWVQGDNITISNSIIRNGNSNSNNNFGVYTDQWLNNFVIYNTLVYDFLTAGINSNYSPDTKNYLIYNNTVINSNNCFDAGYHTGYYLNNIAQDCNIGFSGQDPDSDYNLSDLVGDAIGSNSINESVLTFVDKVGDNFHLVVGDTDAIDNGQDLSVDSYFDFNDDVDGDTRSGLWDIGFDEF